MQSITLISSDSLLLFNDKQTLHTDVFKITSRTFRFPQSICQQCLALRDDHPLEPHDPSTLKSICGISPGKPVPDKTSIGPFCGGIPLPLLMPYSYFELLTVLQMSSTKVYVFSKIFLKLVYLNSAHLLFYWQRYILYRLACIRK